MDTRLSIHALNIRPILQCGSVGWVRSTKPVEVTHRTLQRNITTGASRPPKRGVLGPIGDDLLYQNAPRPCFNDNLSSMPAVSSCQTAKEEASKPSHLVRRSARSTTVIAASSEHQAPSIKHSRTPGEACNYTTTADVRAEWSSTCIRIECMLAGKNPSRKYNSHSLLGSSVPYSTYPSCIVKGHLIRAPARWATANSHRATYSIKTERNLT